MIKNLNETVSLMTSSDFKLRGIAEYYQIKIRTEQNREFIKKWENNELDFTPLNTLEKSKMQLKAMELYEYTLRERLMQLFVCKKISEFEKEIEDYVNRHCVFAS